MKHEGRRVIPLGDKTDHGGTVTSVSSGTIVMGRQAAIEGDMTFCPECKGQFPIKPDRTGPSTRASPTPTTTISPAAVQD